MKFLVDNSRQYDEKLKLYFFLIHPIQIFVMNHEISKADYRHIYFHPVIYKGKQYSKYFLEYIKIINNEIREII